MVLPVRGGATINPRWPLPIGDTRSITRGVKSLFSGENGNSNVSFSCGYSGVRLSKLIRCRTADGSSKLTCSTLRSAKYRSPSCGALIWPSTVSPVRRENRLIWLGET